jgi:uncharacterized protein (TIGR03435 family)
MLWRPADVTLFRVIEGDARVGDTIRSNGGAGAVLALVDGSRIEMRSHTELSLERADDGLRVRLSSGGIIVNAAKQRTGHLYVQTRDMTVSVVGTVFLVNAEEVGSRVAVLEGEVTVQVKQGRPETTLLPGEQVVTNSSMPAPTVREAIAWSRSVDTLLALLRQLEVAAPPVQPAAVSAETRAPFETTSVRLAAPSSPGARSGGPGSPGGSAPCNGVDLQVDPRRFAVRNIPLYGLITLAYGKRCQAQVQHVGGPAWLRADGYDVEASIPAGSPGFTARQLRNGMAPGLQLMLQMMLADRFKLVLHREMREMSVYNLVVVAAGRMTPSAGPDPADRTPPVGTPQAGPAVFTGPASTIPRFQLPGSPISRLIELLQFIADRPVIDRTELTGLFDIRFDVPALDGVSGPESVTGMQDQLSSRLQEQLGLKLEPAHVPVEVLVFDRVERPTEN